MKRITNFLSVVFLLLVSWQANAQFTENFDTGTTLPAGWSIINNGSTQGWFISSTINGGAETGTNAARINFGSAAHDDYLITPAITVVAGTNDRLSYFIRSRSTIFLENYDVLLSTTNNTDPAAFNVTLKANDDAPATWTQDVFDLTPYIGQTVYVAVHATDTNQFELYVDSFTSDTFPPCPDVQNITATTISDGTVSLNWDDAVGASGYNYEIQPNGVAQGTAGALLTSSSPTSDASVASGILTNGVTYTLYVQSNCGSGLLGDYQSINFVYAVPPVNDSCVDAITITTSTGDSCDNQLSGTTRFGTITAPDGCSTVGKDVWYSFTPTETGLYNIAATETFEVGFNSTTVSVFDGACGSLTQVGTGCFSTSFNGELTMGTTYLVNVRSSSTVTASYVDFDLCVTQLVVPANDTCAGALDLAAETSPLTASINGAVSNTDETSCLRPEGRDLFYQILVPDTFDFSFQQTSNTFDSVHRVAYGATCPGDIELFCADFPENNLLEWTNDTGADQTVYIVIEGFATTTFGDFTIAWSVTPPPTCFDPSDVAISNITGVNADVTFTDNNPTAANNYDYELVNLTLGETVSGVANGNATTNPFTVTGLVENNEYEIYVKAVCGVGDESEFSPAASWTQLINVPGCASNFVPVDLAIDVASNAQFTWDAPTTGGTVEEYNFLFGTNAAALTNIGVLAATTTSTGLTNLVLGQTYFWQIVPSNAIGDAVSCPINQFTVIAPPAGPEGVTCGSGDQATSQFTESFDAAGGWTGNIAAGNGSWFFGRTGTTPSGGAGTGPTGGETGAYMYYEASGNVSTTASVVSPLIDLSAITAGDEAEVSFYMHAFGNGIGTLNVGAATNPAGPFTTIFTWTGQIQPQQTGPWLQVGADVTAFSGGDLYLQFSHTGAGAFAGDMSIDTLEVIACDVIPACQAPNMLDFLVTSATETTITWSDPNPSPASAGYQYELINTTQGEVFDGTIEGSVGTGIFTVDLNTLTANEDYEFRIRSLCAGFGGTTSSAWSTTLSWTQTLLPDCAENLMPLDTTTGITPGSVLHTWDAPSTGGPVVSYSFFFGTNPLALTQLGTPTGTQFTITGTAENTTYYWQIVPTNGGGSATGCPIFSYTTGAQTVGGTDCASSVVVTEGSFQSNINGTAPTNNGDSIWFVYTATELGSLTVDSCLGGADTRLFVYDNCVDLNIVAENDDFCDLGDGFAFASSVTFDVVPGEDYYINWTDRWDETTPFTWNINLTPECPDSTTWNGMAWSNGVPDGTKTAIIDGAYNTSIAAIDACAIYVSTTGSLTVAAGTFARANGTIANDGVMIVEHTGNVVQTDDTAVMTNNASLEVVVDSPTNEARDFLISGSPLDGETREAVWGGSYNVQGFTASNFVPFDFGTTQPNVVYNFTDDNLDDWNPHAGALSAGTGYLVFPQDVFGDAGVNIPTFTHTEGNLNNGVITQALNFNTMQLDSPNMLSNPYASAIDTDLFLNANAEIDGVYFWEHGAAPSPTVPGVNPVNYTMEDISFYNLTGGVAAASGAGTVPTGVMASTQGFGVFASAAGTATFNNSMRLTTGNTTLRSTSQDRNRIWLNITNTEFDLGGNMLIGFMEGATPAYDRGFDSERIGTVVSLYSHLDATSDQGYSIQARESFDAGMQISVGFATLVEADSPYVISLSNFDGALMDTVEVYLVDHELNTTTNLSETNYSFTSNVGEFNNRFTVQFVDRSVLGTTNTSLEAISIAPNPADNFVMIVSPVAQVTAITVVDLQGRVVDTVQVNGLNSYQLDMSRLSSAVYFITVNTPSGEITKRIIKR